MLGLFIMNKHSRNKHVDIARCIYQRASVQPLQTTQLSWCAWLRCPSTSCELGIVHRYDQDSTLK